MAKPSILAAGFLAVFTTAALAADPNAQAQLLIYELNRAGNDPGREDYLYVATVDPSALDGQADSNASNDECPRPLSGNDKGCGNKDKATGQLGVEVLTDVVVK